MRRRTWGEMDKRERALVAGAVALLMLAVESLWRPSPTASFPFWASWEQANPALPSTSHFLKVLDRLGVDWELLKHEPLPKPELEPSGALRITGFWTVPSKPHVGDTITYKLTGEGIERAEIRLSVYDPLSGTNSTTHSLTYTNGVWWTRETYNKPCSILAPPWVYGGGESLEGDSLSIAVLPVNQPATVEETVAKMVEQVSEVVQERMISSFEISGVEVPVWVPSLVLLAVTAVLFRRRMA